MASKISIDSKRQIQNGNRLCMAIKKSEIYSSLWASCDELRGGDPANQFRQIFPMYGNINKLLNVQSIDSKNYPPNEKSRERQQ